MSERCGDRLPVDHATLVCGRKAGHEGEHRCTRSDGSITAWGDVPLRPAADRAAMRYGGQVEPRVSVPAPLPPDPAAPDAAAGDGLRPVPGLPDADFADLSTAANPIGMRPAADATAGDGLRAAIRQELDDSVLTHTGRSVGDIASGRVADDPEWQIRKQR